jgi:predicted regulator of Ras-like GTPase activity (Roadblock/LC7/MglB family)
LSRLDGVTGGLLVTPDGLVIASELPSRYPAEALAALGATLGRELEVADERLGRGPFTAACFAAEDGTMFVSGSRVGFVMLLGASTVDAPAVLRALGDALARLD